MNACVQRCPLVVYTAFFNQSSQVVKGIPKVKNSVKRSIVKQYPASSSVLTLTRITLCSNACMMRSVNVFKHLPYLYTTLEFIIPELSNPTDKRLKCVNICHKNFPEYFHYSLDVLHVSLKNFAVIR